MTQRRIPSETADGPGKATVEQEARNIYRVNVDYGDISAGIWRAYPYGPVDATTAYAPLLGNVANTGTGGGGFFSNTGTGTYTVNSVTFSGLYNSAFANSNPPDNGMLVFRENSFSLTSVLGTTQFSIIMELDMHTTVGGGSPTYKGEWYLSATANYSRIFGNQDGTEAPYPNAVSAPYSFDFGRELAGGNTGVLVPHTTGTIAQVRHKVRDLTTSMVWGTGKLAKLATLGYTPGGGVYHLNVPTPELTRLVEF